MFQTEPILFLQSFSNDVLDFLFLLITALGDREPVQFFVIAVIFGVDLRKGFILAHMVVWTAFATGWAKDFFALPRPYYVDAAVRAIGRDIAATPYKGTVASTFFGLPEKTAIEFARWHRMGSFGFPSGHTSGAVALWGGMAVLFQKKWVFLICGLLMVMIPFSRLYLGRHFIADVLGGYALGGVLVFLIYRAVFKRKPFETFLFSGSQLFSVKMEKIVLPLYLFGVPGVLMLMAPSHADYPAMLLGLNLGFFLVRLRGLPDDDGSVVRRFMRVFVAALIFLAVQYLFDLLRMLAPRPYSVIITPVLPAGLMACFIWAAIEMNVRLDLMKRK